MAEVLASTDRELGSELLESLRELRNAGDSKWMDLLVHWTVFDFDLIEEMMDCVGWDTLVVDLVQPYHMIVVARKPQEGSPDIEQTNIV